VALVDVKRAADGLEPTSDRCRTRRSLDCGGPSTSGCWRHYASRRTSGSSRLHTTDYGAPWPRPELERGGQAGRYDGFRRRYRRARPPESPPLGRWQQVLADGLEKNLAIGVRAARRRSSWSSPHPAELTAARRAAHSLASLGRAQVLHVPGAEWRADVGDRNYLVLAKPM
jgi:hypothetical protein